MKKNNKKKLLIIFLFLFALAGVVGYGVYSYYYTEGEVEVNSDTIEVLSFDPEVDIDGNSSFLGSGGTISLTCPDSTRGGETVTCSGTLTVKNEGDTDIYVEVLDGTAELSKNGYIDASASNPRFSWTETGIEEGSSAELEVEVDVDISNGTSGGASSSEAVEVYDKVPGGTINVNASFKLRATQTH